MLKKLNEFNFISKKERRKMLFFNNLMRKPFKKLMEDNSGIGVIEIVLILVVLIALIIIFKDKITAIINDAFGTISEGADTIGV